MPINKHDILAKRDLKRIPVMIPEWEMTVYVRQWSVKEGREFEALRKEEQDLAKVAILVVQHSLCDEEGNLLFGSNDEHELEQKNPEVITRLALEGLKVNGMLASEDSEREKELPNP